MSVVFHSISTFRESLENYAEGKRMVITLVKKIFANYLEAKSSKIFGK